MAKLTTGLAAESGHWYRADGSPAYEIEMKKGGMRAVTLRDARKLNLYPSVTTIIRSAAAPGLEQWKIKQAIHAALTLPRQPEETDDSYIGRILVDGREQARKAAELGTAIHAAIEAAIGRHPYDSQFQRHVDATLLELCKFNCEWHAERSFVSSMGYGGKVDAYSSDGIVIDFKTKEFDESNLPRGWPEQGMQLAAYANGLGLDALGISCPPDRINLFISTTVPGLVHLYKWPRDTYAQHMRMFEHLLRYWQAAKNYAPEGSA